MRSITILAVVSVLGALSVVTSQEQTTVAIEAPANVGGDTFRTAVLKAAASSDMGTNEELQLRAGLLFHADVIEPHIVAMLRRQGQVAETVDWSSQIGNLGGYLSQIQQLLFDVQELYGGANNPRSVAVPLKKTTDLAKAQPVKIRETTNRTITPPPPRIVQQAQPVQQVVEYVVESPQTPPRLPQTAPMTIYTDQPWQRGSVRATTVHKPWCPLNQQGNCPVGICPQTIR